jgi:hypothetical protein
LISKIILLINKKNERFNVGRKNWFFR